MTLALDSEAAFREAFAAALQPRPRRWPTPGAMAQELDPRTVQTPALELIDKALVDLTERRGKKRLACFVSPQEGKVNGSRTGFRCGYWSATLVSA